MSPTESTSSGGFLRWNSPLPYLYGGLGLVLGLIAIALVFLACTRQKKYASTSDENAEEKQRKEQGNSTMLSDTELKIVVVMAGNEIPTYLAKPVSSTGHVEQV